MVVRALAAEGIEGHTSCGGGSFVNNGLCALPLRKKWAVYVFEKKV
jgi:hypothetical protein